MSESDSQDEDVPAEDLVERENDEWTLVLAPLDRRERRFVMELLRGQDHVNAAKLARYNDELIHTRLLGRPHIVRALEALAPLVGDDAEALRILRPVLRRRLLRLSAGEQRTQALGALRDFLSFAAPPAPGARASTSESWQAAQERRALAKARAAGGVTP